MSIKTFKEAKRVLVLTSTFPRWDGDNEPPFVFELSRRLASQFEVLVLCPHASGARTTEQLSGIEIHRFKYFFSKWQTLAYEGGILANLKRYPLNYLLVPFFILAQLISLVRLLRKSRIDVIHAHWLLPQGLVAIVAQILVGQKPAIICTSHGADLFGLNGRFLTWVKRQIIRRVDRLTVVSHAMCNYASVLANRDDIEVIPMGVDLTHRFTPSPEIVRNSTEVLFVGRLVEKKGVRYIISAMPEVIKSFPQAMLLVVGEGPDRDHLQKLAQASGLEENVRFLGAVNNMALRDIYRRTAIFVAPSIVASGGDQEGLGLVLVEALGCACPVVTTDLPAIRDVVIDGVTGVICKQNDSVDLACNIVKLLNNPDLSRALGHAGRQYVLERFDWDGVASRYGALIASAA